MFSVVIKTCTHLHKETGECIPKKKEWKIFKGKTNKKNYENMSNKKCKYFSKNVSDSSHLSLIIDGDCTVIIKWMFDILSFLQYGMAHFWKGGIVYKGQE